MAGISDLANAELNIATAPNRDSKIWDQGVISWGELLVWMDSPADRKECGNYVLGRLDGDQRSKKTIVGRSAITLDADSPQDGFLDRLASALLGTAYVVHTTFKSTPDAPRYRVIVPLAGELAPDLYRAAVVALMAQVSPAGNDFDKGSAQPERYMFKPSEGEPGYFWHQARDGALLDPAPLLAAAEVLTGEDREPAPVGAAGPADPEGYFRRAANGEADKLALTFEGERNEQLNKSAFKLGQLAHVWDGDAEDMAREALLAACEVNGMEEAEFSATFPRSWAAGTGQPRDVKPAAPVRPGSWGPEDQTTRGQLRMAHRLAHAYQGELMYVHGVGWHHWTGTHWAEDKDGAAMRAVDDLLRQSWGESFGDQDLTRDVRGCQSGTAMKGILGIAQTLDGITATVDQVDADPYLLNVANGALDLHTLQLRQHSPADRCTKVSRGAYDPAALGRNWERLLASSLPDEEVRGFLQRYVGQALIGRVIEQKLLFLQGEGSNGKSVWAEAIANALGDYAITPQEGMLLAAKHRSSFDGSVELRGRRWAVLSEVERGRELAPATVKQLTGGDRIRARNLYERNIEFTPSHTLAMLVNDLPRVTDKTTGMWRRLRVVHWDVVIPKEQQDVHLGQNLELEADAVLTWAVAGLRDYNERGGLDEPQQVRVATDAYRNENDDVRRFLGECTEASRGAFIKPSDLYQAYLEWAEANPVRHTLGSKAFSQEVAEVPGMARGGRNKHWANVHLCQPEVEEDFGHDLI